MCPFVCRLCVSNIFIVAKWYVLSGRGKGRWKKDRLRNVGRTDARTHGRTDTKVILYSVQAMHSIALDRQKVNDYIYRALIAHAYRRRISKELRGRLFVNVAAIKLT